MGLLELFERILGTSRQEKRIDFKEILCKRKGDDYIKKIKTPVVGSDHKNIDGSERQNALKKLKKGEKVRLLWNTGDSGNKRIIYLLRSGGTHELAMSDCFGRLNDTVAGDIIRWMTRENIVTTANVVKLTGGTRKRPKQGCVLELRTYPAPDQKA